MDPRFDTSKDPRFKRIPGNVSKIQVDTRFAHMFSDKRFVETPTVDSRGKKVKPNAEKQRLAAFYNLADDKVTRPREGGEAAQTAPQEKPPKVDDEKTEPPKRLSLRQRKNRKAKLKAIRKRQALEEEEAEEDHETQVSSSEEDEDEWEAIGDEEDPIWAHPDQEQVPQGDATRRLAIMGCDWHNISAGDILVMLRSYLSGKGARNAGAVLQGGSVDKVTIYPSDFGLERMKVESEQGPIGLATHDDEDNHDTKAAEAKQLQALRKWQVEQTKYYYAVADCDAASTAAWLYEQLDGISVTGIAPGLMDLRFIPDDLVFPHSPTAAATEPPRKYAGPATFDNTGLGHTNVKCTWDEAPPQRKKALQRKKFTSKEMQDLYLQDYLASSSDDADELLATVAEAKTAMKAKKKDASELRKQLIGSDSEGDNFFAEPESDDDKPSKKKADPMTGDTDWVRVSVSANKLEERLAERVQEQVSSKGHKVRTLDGEEPKSVWEKYLERKKAKRKERKEAAKAEQLARKAPAGDDGADGVATKEELEVLVADEEEDRGFNVRGKKRTAAKRAQKEEGGFQVDINDPRIAKVFSSADFEIDPTVPEYRPSEGMRTVLKEKRQRKLASSARKAAAREGAAPPGTSQGAETARAAKVARKHIGGLQLFA